MGSVPIELKEATLIYTSEVVTLKILLSLKNSFFGKVENLLEVLIDEQSSFNDLVTLLQVIVLKTVKDAIITNKKNTMEDDEIIKMMDINFFYFVPNDMKESTLIKEAKPLSKVKLVLFNEVYIVKVQKHYPILMELPEEIFIDTYVEPIVLKPFEFFENDFNFKWLKSVDMVEWEEIASNFVYSVKREDFGFYLKLICNFKSKKDDPDLYEIISENVVSVRPDLPIDCPFQKRQESLKSKQDIDHFRVISYNILSNRYTNKRYKYCSSKYLSMFYRRELILQEIIGYKPDIICLQEADDDRNGFLMNEFRTKGYVGVLHSKSDSIPEGVFTLYNTNRLCLVARPQKIVYKDIIKQNFLRDMWNVLKEDKKTENLFLRKAQIAHILELSVLGSSDIILVINTHLYFDSDGANVRLFQVICCLEYLKQIIYTEFSKTTSKIHVLFCGDFNSEPTSDAYKFITEGSIQFNNKNKEKFCTTTLHHPFNFKNAYPEHKFTNFTETFKDCIDYIFYSSFNLLENLPIYDDDVLTENVALPSRVFPSDHIALVADLKLT